MGVKRWCFGTSIGTSGRLSWFTNFPRKHNQVSEVQNTIFQQGFEAVVGVDSLKVVYEAKGLGKHPSLGVCCALKRGGCTLSNTPTTLGRLIF